MRAEGTARQKSSSMPTATSELQLFETHAVAVNHADETGAISSLPARRGDQLSRPRLVSPALASTGQLPTRAAPTARSGRVESHASSARLEKVKRGAPTNSGIADTTVRAFIADS